MPPYLSPGVYVEEVPSAVQPIAGVSTSTPGFVGAVPSAGFTLAAPVTFTNVKIGVGDGIKTGFRLSGAIRISKKSTVKGYVGGDAATATVSSSAPHTITFTPAPARGKPITADYTQTGFIPPDSDGAAHDVGQVQLCTSFDDFRRAFGDFAVLPAAGSAPSQWHLAHAVYGFFNNGGSRCYVVRTNEATLSATKLQLALEKLAAIDEIAMVAAPGATGKGIADALIDHCSVQTRNRVAILDGPTGVAPNDVLSQQLAGASDYAALYYPWIEVFDPATKAAIPDGDGIGVVPPSGHVAGIFARVDNSRGIHKAPANEVVLGALGLETLVTKNQQDGLNPQGVNCIRNLNGNILVWGARTWGGGDNGEYTYINVRRLMLYLEKSIDDGLQWVVFEPNTQALWAKIVRNVTAFLTDVWRAGALFGDTAQDAFYVRCDAGLNPESVRSLGQVITEIGVAPARPAEFVIFRLSQWAGPGGG